MNRNIFDIITENSINERLDDILLHNEEYIKIQNKIGEQSEQFDKLEISSEQRQIIDSLISSHYESGAFYSKAAYKQGFKDCASLLQEINLIRAS